MASRTYRMRAGLSEHDMQRAEAGKCYRAEPSEDKFGHKTDLLDLLEGRWNAGGDLRSAEITSRCAMSE